MNKILLIGTGGTIASVHTENGLVPSLTPDDLFAMEPVISDYCSVDCVQVCNLDSTDMRPEHWLEIKDTIKNNFERYDGFVITHGTDTMAYTAAGLSYLVQNSEKPIVITGAQKSLAEVNTDAGQNLIDAFAVACNSESKGVQIVFSGSVILGTRARKNFAKRFMAFGSVNFPEIAHVQDGRIIRYLSVPSTGKTEFYDSLDSNVGLVKLVPGMRNDVMRFIIEKYDGLVVESFGVGGVPEYSDFYDQFIEARKNGKIIVMTTQVPNEGSDLSLYYVGNRLKKNADILEAHDMTTESAFAKLMWILGQTRDFERAEKLFYAPVNNDILL